MIPENARNERTEFLEIGAVTESDEIVQVDFMSVKCVHSFGSITTQEVSRNGGERIKAICQVRVLPT